MPVINRIASFHKDMTAWRHDIHSHPETAFEEVRTADIVADKLKQFGLEVHRGLAKTGVVGVLRSGTSRRAIGLRADMDALDVHETNSFDHKSTIPGKMHACGHDGHTVMLLDTIPDLEMTGRQRAPVAGEVPSPINPPSGCTFHPRCPFANERCRVEQPQLLPIEGGTVACHAIEEGRLAVEERSYAAAG